MKKFVAFILAFSSLLLASASCLLVPSASAIDESASAVDKSAESIESTVVAFEYLVPIIIDNNETYREYLQTIGKLETSLREMNSSHADMLDYALILGLGNTMIELQDNMKYTQEVLDEMNDTLLDVALQLALPAQKMYLSHYILSIEADIATRKLDALENDLPAFQLKLTRGLITQSALDDLEKAIRNQKDLLKQTQRNIDDNLEALAKFLGLEYPISLAGLPSMNLSFISDRDLDADLAAYRLSAPSVAEKERVMKNAKRTYKYNADSKTDKYAYETALEEYNKAIKDAEKDFPNFYKKLYDAYDDYITSTLVPDFHKDFEKLSAQYAAGLVPETVFNEASRAMLEVTDRYQQQLIQLWITYLDYEFALTKLNI